MIKTATKRVNILAAGAAALALFASPATFAGKPDGPGQPGPLNIVEVAVATNMAIGEFDNLLAAVGCFGPLDDNPVVDLLSGDDRLTLFAPNDAAFDALLAALGISDPCDVDEALFPGALLTVLQYHITEGRRFANSVFSPNGSSKELEMLAGGTVISFIGEDGPTLHDNAGQMVGVVPPFININASNGVVHVIDTVLLPLAP
jgi:uncharacterized surface protein with fasciclin (FAS1) repeats